MEGEGCYIQNPRRASGRSSLTGRTQHFTVLLMERWLSGRKRHPAKVLYPARGTEGSNPSLSAPKADFRPFFMPETLFLNSHCERVTENSRKVGRNTPVLPTLAEVHYLSASEPSASVTIWFRKLPPQVAPDKT